MGACGPHREEKLTPRPSGLSFHNWDTRKSTANCTPQFEVLADNGTRALLFRNKRSRKMLNVNPKAAPGEDVSGSAPMSTQRCYSTIMRRDACVWCASSV